jgi:hypothetical protein
MKLKFLPAWCIPASHSRKATTAAVNVLLKKLEIYLSVTTPKDSMEGSHDLRMNVTREGDSFQGKGDDP